MDLELQENVAFYMSSMKEDVIEIGVPLGTTLMLTCKGCNKINDTGCSTYKDPMVLSWHRHNKYCPMNPPAIAKKKVKINPLKASKRGQ